MEESIKQINKSTPVRQSPGGGGNQQLLKEFKPSLLFLGKFLAIYFVLNIIYGIYIESYGTRADGVTYWVSNQCASILNLAGYNSTTSPVVGQPKISIDNNGDGVINVFEGCNGINIMILFIAFVVAFKGDNKTLFWFIPVGLLFIHLANLARIALLYWVAQEKPDYMYFTHKYVFTAVIYASVFLLWTLWVTRYSNLNKVNKSS